MDRLGRDDWQAEQAKRCPCKGSDEMCPCQNAHFALRNCDFTKGAFENNGGCEERWTEDVKNACPACAGSGHKDDAASFISLQEENERLRKQLEYISLVAVSRAVQSHQIADELMCGALDPRDAFIRYVPLMEAIETAIAKENDNG